MNKQPWRDRFAKALELLFAQRNTSAMTADARAQFELGASALAAVAAFWLWALATLQLRGGHFWQWAAALASALFVVLFGVRAAQLRGAQWRFALRARVLEGLGGRRVASSADPSIERGAVYSKAVVVIVIARLLAELGWALERPTSGPLTILVSLGLGGATLAFSLLWLVWITMELRVALGRFAYECAITERPTPDGFVKLYLVGPKLSQTDAIVATLIAPSGGRYFCVHSARNVVINEAGEGTYELEVRLSDPRDVPWNFVGSEPASLELMVAPGFTATFALGFEIDALRPKRPRY